MEFFGLMLIGVAAGVFAEKFLTGKGFGAIADIIVGVAGALIGAALFEEADILTGSNLLGSLIFATIGAIALLFAVRRVRGI
jgi:uncharacterized membrane protein YeaQ/YmgE (transglycosylase-associated protein family)